MHRTILADQIISLEEGKISEYVHLQGDVPSKKWCFVDDESSHNVQNTALVLTTTNLAYRISHPVSDAAEYVVDRKLGDLIDYAYYLGI